MPKAHGPPHLPPVHQADAAISQVNPVSNQLYTVLATTTNVRIISIAAQVTWAAVQPTPLVVLVTIDGQVITHYVNNPVSANPYEAIVRPHLPENDQPMLSGFAETARRAFLYEGRSVKVECYITWGVAQPTPLVCRVKWARW